MPTFDYGNLSPHDFEALVGDLLHKEEGVRIERFMPGPDGGVDLRLFKGGAIVVQCKRYLASHWSKLKAEVQEEANKIKALDLSDYWLFTTCPLSPKRKADLFQMLSPSVSRPERIFGRDDIDGLLTAHPDVLRSHAKLWLTSGDVLNTLVHKAAYLFAEWSEESLMRVSRKFVRTRSVEDLFDILEERRACIISGAPGVGKTTLARIACLEYAQNGYEIVVVTDVGAVLQLWDDTKKQVFFYDDFLGKSSLAEKLAKNEDAQLLATAERVAHDPRKRLIMATREYILSRARRIYEGLDTMAQDLNPFILRVLDFSRYEKAQILYNHLFFSDLDNEEWLKFCSKQYYESIVDHEKFMPRIIDWMTGPNQVKGKTAESIRDSLLETLDNPARIWKHAFENQIDELSRTVLMLLAAWGDRCEVSTLQDLLVSGLGNNRRDVDVALKHLDDSFISSSSSEQGTFIKFHDPGVRDLAVDALVQDDSMIGILRYPTLRWEFLESVPEMMENDSNCWDDEEIEALLIDQWSFVRTLATRRPVRVLDRDGGHATRVEIDFRRCLRGLQVAKSIESTALARLWLDMTSDSLREGGPFADVQGVTSTLEAIDMVGLVGNEEYADFLVTFRDWLVENCTGVSDLEELKALFEHAGFNVTSQARDSIQGSCDNWLAEDIRQATDDDSAGGVRQAIEEVLLDVGNFFGLDFAYNIQRMWEDHHEPDYDEDDYRIGRGGAAPALSNGGSIDAVADLFSSAKAR